MDTDPTNSVQPEENTIRMHFVVQVFTQEARDRLVNGHGFSDLYPQNVEKIADTVYGDAITYARTLRVIEGVQGVQVLIADPESKSKPVDTG